MRKAEKGKRTEYRISPEDFVRIWQTSTTAQEVAEKTGMPKPIVLARASAYRKAGIKLKKMSRRTKRALDVQGLNRLIEELKDQATPKK